MITFIINPASGSGKTKRRLKPLIKEIRAHNQKANILITRHPLHAIGLAKKAIQGGAQRLVVIGGDGTLNEVINGCFDGEGKPHNENLSIAVIPSGTGTDFYRNTGHRPNFKDAIEFAIDGTAKPTDVGLVFAHDANGNKVSRYFINVSSMGLSGLVAGFMKTVTRVFGSQSAYFIATVQAIRVFSPPSLRIKGFHLEETIENCSLISFANGKFFGSGMKIAPNAKLDDGLMDIITIKDLSASFFLLNGYRVYRGMHIGLPNVHEYHQKDCVVESLNKDPVYIETDGELFAQLPAKYFLLPQALKMVR